MARICSRRVRWRHFMDAYKQFTQFSTQFAEQPQLPSPILHMQKLTEFLKPAGSRGIIRCAGDVESGAWKWRTRWVRNGEKKESLSIHPITHNGIWIWTWFSCKRNQHTSPSELQMAAAAATIYVVSTGRICHLLRKGRSLNQDDVSASPKIICNTRIIQYATNIAC